MGVAMDDVIRQPDFRQWLPVRVKFDQGKIWIDLARPGEERLTAPFFKESAQRIMQLPFNQAFRQTSAADEMVEWTNANTGIAPTAFIFHASRCGSTLMAQMLASLPSHIVVSEPPMLDALLRAHFFVEGLARQQQLAYVRALVRALAQPRFGESKFVVKMDAWNIFELDLIREAFPTTPWVFLYRDPLEIAVSQLRQRASYMVPGLIGPSQWMFNQQDALSMSDKEYVARILGKIFEEAARVVTREPNFAGCVHYNQLPSAMWETLGETFGVQDGGNAAATATMQAAAKWDAKNPYFEFVKDAEEKQREATPLLRQLVDQWVRPHYDALEKMRGAYSTK
jgi:hypothetical protein